MNRSKQWGRNTEMRIDLWRSWLALDQSARDPHTHAHTKLSSTKIGRVRKLIIVTHDCPVEPLLKIDSYNL